MPDETYRWTPVVYRTQRGKTGNASAAIITDVEPNALTVNGGIFTAIIFLRHRRIKHASFKDDLFEMKLNTCRFRFEDGNAYLRFKAKLIQIYNL